MTEKLKKAAVWILLTAGALVMMFPFIWMLATSLKTLPEATAIPPSSFLQRLSLQIMRKLSPWRLLDGTFLTPSW